MEDYELDIKANEEMLPIDDIDAKTIPEIIILTDIMTCPAVSQSNPVDLEIIPCFLYSFLPTSSIQQKDNRIIVELESVTEEKIASYYFAKSICCEISPLPEQASLQILEEMVVPLFAFRQNQGGIVAPSSALVA